MGFQFAETMRGTIEWDTAPGVLEPFSFDVRAVASSSRAYLSTMEAELSGTVHAPPLGDLPGSGVITIKPIGGRFIRYHLEFGDYVLDGEKTIRWLSPRESFTHLPAEITKGGLHVAHVESDFDLKDLWTFLRSFRPA